MSRSVGMELTEIIAQVHERVPAVDFSDEIARYDIGPEHRAHLRRETPYRCRAALVKVLGARSALEVGTKTGCGALALAKYADRVLTCDVALGQVHDRRIFDGRIEGRELASPEDCLELDYPAFDFVFIDIDHRGEMEYRIHQVLAATYRGVVLFDDIDYNDEMRAFWAKIGHDKAETLWQPPHGAGLVRY